MLHRESAASLTEKQIYELIFASGFSTAEKISDVSGRGVGLDVVKNTIESLGGSVSIDLQEGAGFSFLNSTSTYSYQLFPLCLLKFKKKNMPFHYLQLLRRPLLKKEDIMNAHNQQVIDFRGKVLPLLFLKDIFEVPIYKEEDEFLSVVIVRKGDKLAGLVVDSFIGQLEIVLKS